MKNVFDGHYSGNGQGKNSELGDTSIETPQTEKQR